MRYIHLTTSEIRKLITTGAVVAETSKRGSTVSYAVQFVDDNAAIVELQAPQTSGALTIGKRYVITAFVAGDDFTNVGAASNVSGTAFVATGTTPANWTHSSRLDGETVTIGFKAQSGYDSVAFVLGPFTAVKTGTGTAAVYTFTLSFLSALLDQLLATNLDEVDLVAEIKWTSALYNGETLAFAWTVQNNVNRGGESVPSYPVTATTQRLPQVSRLTGGVLATDLDAQLLAGYPNGTVIEVITYDAILAGRVGSRWEKDNTRSESVTSIGDGVIICTDGTKLFRA